MKKVIVFALSIILVVSTLCVFPISASGDNVWDGVSVSASLSGAGTLSDPYLISSGADLAFMRKEINSGNAIYSSAQYKQTADIDLNGYNVKPIGPTKTAGSFLSGVYNAEGYTISNFVVDSNDKYVGLFGYIEGAYIENLKVEDASVSSNSGEASSAVGIIVGYINNGSFVSKCQTGANSYVESLNIARAGGVVGWNYSSTIEFCINRALVVYNGPTTAYAGGVTGTLGKDGGLVENCINIGPVISQSYAQTNKLIIGGVVGFAGGSTGLNETRNSYNMGLVANQNEFIATDVGVGGLTGCNNKAQTKFTDCYNVAPVFAASGTYNSDRNFIASIIGYTTAGDAPVSEYCYSLTQTGISATADAPIANIALVSSLTDSISRSGGGTTTLGAAISQIDSIVSTALGIVPDWAATSFDLESADVALAEAIALQDKHVDIITNAPNEGETQQEETTPADTTTGEDPVDTTTGEDPVDTTTGEDPVDTTTGNDPEDTTTAGDDPKPGCGSSIGVGAVFAITVVAAAGVSLTKKKKH